jgi:plastocyanin
MRRLVLLPLALVAAVALAACTAGTTAGPTTAGSAPTAPPSGGGAACATAATGTAATVTVEYKNFKPAPDPVTAKVGDVVGWTNGDSAPHTAILDDGSCGTDNISQGATGLLVFNTPGTYTYHCKIHPDMKGFTIQVK